MELIISKLQLVFTRAAVGRKADFRSGSGTAVAIGGVIRIVQKGGGPERITQSSYGFLRTEPYQPLFVDPLDGERCPHDGQRPYTDLLDGIKYIKNTIYWFIRKVSCCMSSFIVRA